MANTLFITNDLDYALEEIKKTIQPNQRVIFEEDEFKVESAREVISKAYISSEEEKFIIIKAKKYNEVSQNALLKVLEESPRGVIIYLIGLSKSIFLPTIRSRVITKTLNTEVIEEELDFDFNRLDINKIYEFIKTNDRFMNKQRATLFLTKALKWYKNSHLKLDEDLLNFFAEAKKLIELNSNPQSVLITLFLNLIEVQKSAKTNTQLR